MGEKIERIHFEVMDEKVTHTLNKFCFNIEDQKIMSWTVLLLRGFVINTLRRKDIVGVHQQVQLASLVSSTLNFIKTMCVK